MHKLKKSCCIKKSFYHPKVQITPFPKASRKQRLLPILKYKWLLLCHEIILTFDNLIECQISVNTLRLWNSIEFNSPCFLLLVCDPILIKSSSACSLHGIQYLQYDKKTLFFGSFRKSLSKYPCHWYVELNRSAAWLFLSMNGCQLSR